MIGKVKIKKIQFPSRGEALIYIAFEDSLKKDQNLRLLNELTAGKLQEKFKLYDFSGNENEILSLELYGFYKEIIIAGVRRENWQESLANAFRLAQTKKISEVTFFYNQNFGDNFFEVAKKVALAFYLTNYSFDCFKNKQERQKTRKIEVLNFVIPANFSGQNEKEVFHLLEKGVNYGRLLAEGVYLARDLVNQPASHLYPQTLMQEAFKIEKESGGQIKVNVLDENECRRLGMGAFLAVAQGSDRKPMFIVLKYQTLLSKRGSSKEKVNSICLIGKSITFDSGGLSLKPSEGMETMKIDMAGGAVVLGVFKILAHLGKIGLNIDKEVYGILPACENMPSGKALKPGDIVSCLNGKTIEVLNTDAEGRLTLADALVYAQKYLKTDVIIDLATLTGACMVALGKEIAGLFGNDDSLSKEFLQTAKKEGEKLWQLPLYEPYAKNLKSTVADIKNITGDRYGGAITAALFLSEFVKDAKWIHLDIAGPAFSYETRGTTSQGATGWGLLTIIDFLKNYGS